MDVALSVSPRKSTGGMAIAFERSGRTSGVVVDVAVRGEVPLMRPEPSVAGRAGSAPTSTVINIAVIKGRAVREISLVVEDGVVVMPVKAPMTPSPAEAAVKADAEANSKEQVGSAEPDSRIGIPSRPGDERRPDNDTWRDRGA